MIRIHLVQDICLDIYCLVINEPDSCFEFLNCPTEEWIDPIEIFQKELPYAERGNLLNNTIDVQLTFSAKKHVLV